MPSPTNVSLAAALLTAIVVFAPGCAKETTAKPESSLPIQPSMVAENEEPVVSESAEFEVAKSDAQWREELSSEQFRILRQKGTERAFTGKYWDTKTEGTYVCAGCGQVLYTSETKFDSGCGWPSFYEATEGAIVTAEDNTLGMRRIELMCSKCGGHLGHVFNDGPAPTGLRHCINSASLELIPDDDSE